MITTNYHTHSSYCDGQASPEEMAEAAARGGFDILGFSSHAPLPFPTDWTMPADRLPAYLETIRRLATAWQGRMLILCGLEIDYIPGLCGPAQEPYRSIDLDYRLAAVHYVGQGAEDPSGLVAVDMGYDELRAFIASHCNDDPRRLVEAYYQALSQCVRDGGFDILAHLDLVKKNNSDGRLFDAGSPWYRDAVMLAVDSLEQSELIVEVNTGGLARGKTDQVYPEAWILRELAARKVPVCLNADAHRPEHLASHRQAGMDAIATAGYRRLYYLDRNGRQFQAI